MSEVVDHLPVRREEFCSVYYLRKQCRELNTIYYHMFIALDLRPLQIPHAVQAALLGWNKEKRSRSRP